MSAPYWGQLPDPKVARDHRRVSADNYGDDHPPPDHRQSLDAQPPRKTNRASVQTTNTESTFSPHSPTASSFAAQGLAPRPPSYQRGAGQEPVLDATERMSRSNRTPTDYDDPSIATPPPAPDVPRGPPVSYRHPYGNGALPYTYAAPTNTAPPRSHALPQTPGEEMDPEGYYTTRRDALPDVFQRTVHHVSARRDGAAVPQDMAAQPRRPSATGSSERRRKFANDRSPLQRLELTLDSMTKEEKRARVEAAEQRARQRAAMKAGDSPAGQQTRALDQRQFVDRDIYQAARVPPAAAAPVAAPAPQEVAVQRAPSTRDHPRAQHPPHERVDYGYNAIPPQELVPSQRPVDIESGVPQRNLSFRERAARNEASTAKTETSPAAPATSGGGFSLTRSGSNKLRKEPPGEPQHQQPQGAERMPSVSRQAPLAAPADNAAKIIPLLARNKELPPIPASPDPRGPSVRDGSQVLQKWAAEEPVQVIRRHATEPIYGREREFPEEHGPITARGQDLGQGQAVATPPAPQDAAAAQRRLERQDSGHSSDDSQHHRVSGMLYNKREDMRPGEGLYKPPEWLDEWKKGTTGTLSGALLDLSTEQLPATDKNKPWWESSGRERSSSHTSRQRKAEAFDGEYDDRNAPTRFKPPLYLKCGPLLRYCGIRREKFPTRSTSVSEREIWRGSIMIVTKDSESSYEIAPILRLFVQDIGLLPPPPQQVNGDLPQEYVDPIAGHPKLGRRGETLYVRPVEHLEEAKDLSRDETDNGLFETTRSPPDVPPADGSTDLPGSFARRRKAVDIDGEKTQKYKDVRGFRLHVERGCTFWRFNIEVELRDKQQRIAYRINRGPCMGFWVPARNQAMNIMFYSCNGFSASAKPDELSGPDPMWRDVLNTHQTQPFHVMVGGGDQIYNDCAADECELFDEWLDIRNPLHKHNAPFTAEMQSEMEDFYLERYCMWFSQGLFGLATSQIPMVNMYDDHDIFDGYGSYPHHDMNSPVFCGLGAVAFKYYMLFQHQSLVGETENSEPSWVLGLQPGPYINELSRSLFVSMGGKVALLAVDCRTERTEHDVVQDRTWEKIMNRLYAEVRRGQVEHLLVLVGVPIAYPRLVWLENILTSRLMNPVKALGRTGVFGKALNNIDGGVEVLDDLNDHWTAKNHKHERSIILEDLQDLAIDKSLRITLLSGDVHLAAVGQFYSNPKLGLAKHRDPRYMPNIISSAMANTPPSDLMADVLNKRNKVHHFDKQTDESMIPMFQQGVDGKPRNNKNLLPHRNWCSIRQWLPGSTPPPTPPLSAYDRSPSPPQGGGGGILRRLSSRNKSTPNRFDGARDSVRGPRPPVSGGMGLFRSFSRRASSDTQRPGKLTRTLSLGSGETRKRGFLGFGRRGGESRPDDGGINGQWGAESDEDEYLSHAGNPAPAARPSGLRGGGTHDEYAEGDDSYFAARPPGRAQTIGTQPPAAANEPDAPMMRPFHRTPTGLSTKQMRKADRYEVDLEGGLDITLNVEVNAKDPTGITVPYRLLVPRLQYEYDPAEDELAQKGAEPGPSGFKRLFSLRKKPAKTRPVEQEEDMQSDEDEEEYPRR
ncbi:Uncharacterized protein TPAR_00697 [Tolypocladium paradoxum]|uniref:PhoD-like phosphatase domain-containing protein n=1 Tax=Tolypocladium paradoxum TaxID=94208 RepID=A0A2S4L9L9_9HYPO|nr:Uncharacterized protein TPAR_00697 [Tolypocladium paradoxum]